MLKTTDTEEFIGFSETPDNSSEAVEKVYNSIDKDIRDRYVNKFGEESFKEIMIKNLLDIYYLESVVTYITDNVYRLDKLTKKDVEKIKDTGEFSNPIRDTIGKVSKFVRKIFDKE